MNTLPVMAGINEYPYLMSGWWAREYIHRGWTARYCRYAGVIELPHSGIKSLTLLLTGPEGPVYPLTGTLSTGGQETPFQVTGPVVHLVPLVVAKSPYPVVVEIRMDRVWVPDQLWHNHDIRPMGVALLGWLIHSEL